MSGAAFLLGADGAIDAATPDAATWWKLAPDASLSGRAFAGMFYFGAPGAEESSAWRVMLAAASTRPLTLQARVDGESFEARVEITPVRGADGIATAYLARVEKIEPVAAQPQLTKAASADAASPLDREFAGARIGFFSLDLEFETARFSAGWKNLLGYAETDLEDEPRTLVALVHPDDSEALPQAIGRGAPGERTPYSSELRLRTKEEGWRWMQLEGLCEFGDDGALARASGVMLDAQERHELDDEALQNDERFRRLTSRGRGGCFELDFAHDAAWFAPEFRHALGYRADELGVTPDAWARLLGAEDAQLGPAAFFRSLTRGLPGSIARYQLRHKDGRMLDFIALLSADFERSGEIERVVGLQLPASAAEPAPAPAAGATPVRAGGFADAIADALDAVAEAVAIIDGQGAILHVNSRAAQQAGAAADALVARPFTEVFRLIDRATRTPVRDLLAQVLGGGSPVELDHSYAIQQSNETVEVVLTCRALLDTRGRTTGALVVMRKPTEMPLSPSELLTSNRMEALGRLACGIAHDFNNLLTTVTGGLSLARDKRDWAPLETAEKACGNARNLARQLLTFARGNASGKKVQALNDVLRDTVRMAGAGAKCTIELELAQDLHPVQVDAAQMVQVFTNLILNAMQVMPDGGRIWMRSLNMPLGQVNSVNLAPGDYVRVDVQDNGPGIPRENLARIFEPFFTTRADGTGLGLPMCRSIITQHEGAIEAASTVGSGTTFTIYLPRAFGEAVQPTPRPLSVAYGTGRILVMDDDPDLCMIAKGMLEMLGYEADTASSAAETLALFRRNLEIGRKYAAVILDLTMSGGPGGEDVLVKLREMDAAVKAIVSSGYATEENAAHYHALGFAGMLSKPYRSGDLGRVLKEVISASR